MRVEIRMPRLSEFSDEGTIAKWRVSVGDFVEKGETVADVEVDMTTTEVQAAVAGKIVEIWVHAGQSVPVETVIAMQSVEESVVGQEENESDSDTARYPSDISGAGAEEEPDPGTNEVPDRDGVPQGAAGEDNGDDAVVRYGHVLASPAAIQLAEQYNIKLETLTGTGSCGRIEREDVEAAMQASSQFITPEDVDELMNFDGDFSSDFASSDSHPEQQPDSGNRIETSEKSDATEKDATTETGSVQEGSVAEKVDGEEMPEPSEESGTTRQEENKDQAASGEDFDEDVSEAGAAANSEAVKNSLEEDTTDPERESDMEDISAGDEDMTQEEPEISGEVQEEEGLGQYSTAEKSTLIDSAEADTPGDTVEEEVAEEPDVEEATVNAAGETDGSGAAEIERLSHVDSENNEVAGDEAMEETFEEDVDDEKLPATAEETEIEIESESLHHDIDADSVESPAGNPVVMNDAGDEAEALQISETDTIASEEEPEAIEEESPEDFAGPEPVSHEATTVEQAIERVGSGESVKVRRLVARKMEQSWQAAPHFFVTVAVDMTDVIRFRNDLGVTINDFILAAATRALQEHPWVNSHFIDDRAVEQNDINISLAVETENGLYYPVVRNCDGKTVKNLGVAAAEMVVKAHSGKLTDEEMEGGSFTISNMGMLGVESFSAVIMPPQVAVLAVGTVKGEVIIDEHEEMTMAPMVRLTLSADHRALDGADAADFLGTIKSYLEAPITLVASQEG